MKKILTSVALIVSLNANAVLGPIPIYLNPTDLKSNIITVNDFNSTFASEIYTDDDIEKSGLNNIFDFLGQNTSLVVTPNSGNLFSQKVNTRGFGLTNGYENIVITLNGRRLNAIDSVPQYLANIDINNIKKIEITKGSGSVIYGDGAMGGGIHIYTKNKINTSSVSVSTGNYGAKKISIVAGFSEEKMALIYVGNREELGGYNKEDATGNKTKSTNNNHKITLTLTPSDKTEFMFSQGLSKVDTRYPGNLTLSEFNTDPSQSGSRLFNSTYTQQKYDLNNFNTSIKYKINNNSTTKFNYSLEDKNSTTTQNGGSPSTSKYKNDHKSIILTHQKGRLNIVSGVNLFGNKRANDGLDPNTTVKDSKAIFTKAIYKLGKNSYSLGARKEVVNYKYVSTLPANPSITDNHKLTAFDVGINRAINNNLSIFANYNKGFQAPNIDNFFKFNTGYSGQEFNGFIEPAKIKTLNVGLSHKTNETKTKLTVFKSNLTNEIYLHKQGWTWTNANIDKSYKYGLELQHKQSINPKLSTNFNYAYTIAKIDKETQSGDTYDGNNLPGVSKHNITLGITYQINNKSKINIAHKWRSEAHAAEDFSNTDSQKQTAFKNTDITYKYRYSKNLEFSANIQNLFKNKNGFWLRNDVVTPNNFTRNFNAGVIYKF
jgi:iron complex outermembrane receptor protein